MNPGNAGARKLLLELFHSALQAVDGRSRVRAYLHAHPVPAPVFLIALGKAACAMARGAHEALGENIRAALVVTKQGYAEPLPWPVLEAGHPVPDARSLAAGEALRHFVDALPPAARVLVLLSGGASALMECLPAGVDLGQLQRINDWMLSTDLDVVEMNRLRKRLSLIKGGRLATMLAPREVLCLAISDVPADNPRSIGSGPLSADETSSTTPNALLPDFLRAALAAAPPLPRADDPCFARVRIEIVARLDDAKAAAAAAARKRGYRAQLDPEFIAGDAVQAGARLAQALLRQATGVVQIWGGETTVRLPPRPGRGGRNQSLALAAAFQLAGRDDAFFLSAGTDGTDGPTPDAGALVDGGTVERAAAQGLDARAALTRADAGTFLEASGDLIHTGPTGTNVMDLMIGLRQGDATD
jgi:hydroxypyruvate reductase